MSKITSEVINFKSPKKLKAFKFENFSLEYYLQIVLELYHKGNVAPLLPDYPAGFFLSESEYISFRTSSRLMLLFYCVDKNILSTSSSSQQMNLCHSAFYSMVYA